jgi:type 1 glutamine amidotransferase
MKIFIRIGLIGLVAITGTFADTHLHKVLVYSKTAGYRADMAIKKYVSLVKKLGVKENFSVDSTEDIGAFTLANLKRYDVIVFNNSTHPLYTSTPVPNDYQNAFQQYMNGGGGFVGIGTTSYSLRNEWGWYDSTMLIHFSRWTGIDARLVSIDSSALINPELNDLINFLPKQGWNWTNEWYTFRSSPRDIPGVSILFTVKEHAVTWAGDSIVIDNPVAWCYKLPPGPNGFKGRVLFTATGGPNIKIYDENYLAEHYLSALRWAAGDLPSISTPIKTSTAITTLWKITNDKGVVKITISTPSSFQFEIISLNGEQVFVKQGMGPQELHFLQPRNPGVYIVKANINGQQFSEKLIVTK